MCKFEKIVFILKRLTTIFLYCSSQNKKLKIHVAILDMNQIKLVEVFNHDLNNLEAHYNPQNKLLKPEIEFEINEGPEIILFFFDDIKIIKSCPSTSLYPSFNLNSLNIEPNFKRIRTIKYYDVYAQEIGVENYNLFSTWISQNVDEKSNNHANNPQRSFKNQQEIWEYFTQTHISNIDSIKSKKRELYSNESYGFQIFNIDTTLLIFSPLKNDFLNEIFNKYRDGVIMFILMISSSQKCAIVVFEKKIVFYNNGLITSSLNLENNSSIKDLKFVNQELILQFYDNSVQFISFDENFNTFCFTKSYPAETVNMIVTNDFYQLGYEQILFFKSDPKSENIDLKFNQDDFGLWSIISKEVVRDQKNPKQNSLHLDSVSRALERSVYLSKQHLQTLEDRIKEKKQIISHAHSLLSNITDFQNEKDYSKDFVLTKNLVPLITQTEMIVENSNSEIKENTCQDDCYFKTILINSFISGSGIQVQIHFQNTSKSTLFFDSLLFTCKNESLEVEQMQSQINVASKLNVVLVSSINSMSFNVTHEIHIHCYVLFKINNLEINENTKINYVSSFQINSSAQSTCPIQAFPAYFSTLAISKNNSLPKSIPNILKNSLPTTQVLQKSNLSNNVYTWGSQSDFLKIKTQNWSQKDVRLDFFASNHQLLFNLIQKFKENLPDGLRIVENPLLSTNLSLCQKILSSLKSELKYLIESENNFNTKIEPLITEEPDIFSLIKSQIDWKNEILKLQIETNQIYLDF